MRLFVLTNSIVMNYDDYSMIQDCRSNHMAWAMRWARIFDTQKLIQHLRWATKMSTRQRWVPVEAR